MTPATKAIYRWLLSDYIKVSNISTDELLYTEKDLEKSMDKIETINFHQVCEISSKIPVSFSSMAPSHNHLTTNGSAKELKYCTLPVIQSCTCMLYRIHGNVFMACKAQPYDCFP